MILMLSFQKFCSETVIPFKTIWFLYFIYKYIGIIVCQNKLFIPHSYIFTADMCKSQLNSLITRTKIRLGGTWTLRNGSVSNPRKMEKNTFL